MTVIDFDRWNHLTQVTQIKRFKSVRKKANMTQKQLGEALVVYGYRGGVATIKSWEQGRSKIPPLVYELMYEEFTCREKDE